MHHDYEVMAYTVGLYTHYIRSLRRAVSDMELEVAEHEQSLALMGVDYSKGAGSGPSRDKLPDGVIRLVQMRERLIDEHGRCDSDTAHARKLCRGNDDRWAVWLHKVEGMTYAEVGRQLFVSKATARRMVERGTVSLYYVMPEEWRREMPNALPE